MRTLTYQEAARQLLAQGLQELAEGDSRQASEKGWGAAAQMIKAIAADRGWKHDSHASLYPVIDKLVNETGDEGIRVGFGMANGLHQNFYENWGSSDYVAGGLAHVCQLLDQAGTAAGARGPPTATTGRPGTNAPLRIADSQPLGWPRTSPDCGELRSDPPATSHQPPATSHQPPATKSGEVVLEDSPGTDHLGGDSVGMAG